MSVRSDAMDEAILKRINHHIYSADLMARQITAGERDGELWELLSTCERVTGVRYINRNYRWPTHVGAGRRRAHSASPRGRGCVALHEHRPARRVVMDYPPTVALTQCPAVELTDGDEVTLSGLYDVEEFCPCEPSNYVWSDCYTLSRHGDDSEDPTAYSVDAYVFTEQTDPRLHAIMLVHEREMMRAEEQRDLDERFGTSIAGRCI